MATGGGWDSGGQTIVVQCPLNREHSCDCWESGLDCYLNTRIDQVLKLRRAHKRGEHTMPALTLDCVLCAGEVE